MRTRLIILLISITNVVSAQFAPPAGQTGSTAIKFNSYKIIGWAKTCSIERGWLNAADTSLGKASFGNDNDAIGSANPAVVSLGDGGEAILTFEIPIENKVGFDFAVFENSFDDSFLELAHVEVSSDGINYIRFPSVCNIQNSIQTDPFGITDATKIYNLAGKYRGQYGTPFDLEELKDSIFLDIDNISHVKIIDVIGSIDSSFATFDSHGNIINDPYPTDFPNGGFDLDAVAIIDESALDNIDKNIKNSLVIFPNPVEKGVKVSVNRSGKLYNSIGNLVLNCNYNEIDTDKLSKGIYYFKSNHECKPLIIK